MFRSYRIKEVVQKNGDSKFYPQKRGLYTLFFWTNFEYANWIGTAWYSSLKVAEDNLRDYIGRERESEKVHKL